MDHPGTDEPEARIHYKTLRRTVNLINLNFTNWTIKKKREKLLYSDSWCYQQYYRIQNTVILSTSMLNSLSDKEVTISFGNYFAIFGDAAGTESFLLTVVTTSSGGNWGLCDLEDDPEERLSTGFP